MSDNFPIGTVARPGGAVSEYRGRIKDIPQGWVLAVGQTLRPDQHDHPNKIGLTWTLPDMRRHNIIGTSTSLSSMMDDEGNLTNVAAANYDVPGIYCLVKIKNGP